MISVGRIICKWLYSWSSDIDYYCYYFGVVVNGDYTNYNEDKCEDGGRE